MMRRVDLRSDIVSTPPPSVMEAMVAAARKPRGYGMREDIDQRELETLSAAMLGMQDALFFPTCSMANQVALMLRCSPGTYVLADRTAHLCGVEGSATAGVAGVAVAGVEGRCGHLIPEQVSDMLGRSLQETQMPVRLVWLENTHNVAGGTVMPAKDFHAIVDIAKTYAVPVHIDGARIWNAVGFHGTSPAEVVRGADSVAFSLNKVLGAPLGAVLVGSRVFIADALRVRNMLGGGWRPAGILAAAGVVALKERTARVVDDHQRAARLADELMAPSWLEIDRERVQTNIIVARPRSFAGSRTDLIAALKDMGVLVTPHGTQGIRMVLHGDIDDEAIEVVLDAFRKIFAHHDREARVPRPADREAAHDSD
jgi:threonine aldolase